MRQGTRTSPRAPADLDHAARSTLRLPTIRAQFPELAEAAAPAPDAVSRVPRRTADGRVRRPCPATLRTAHQGGAVPAGGRVDLLCINELGCREPDRRSAELLFQVLTEHEERNSVAIASNESFGRGRPERSRLCGSARPSSTVSPSAGTSLRPEPSPTGSPAPGRLPAPHMPPRADQPLPSPAGASVP